MENRINNEDKEYNVTKGIIRYMKLNWKKILFFGIILFLYYLPSIIFPPIPEYYNSLKGIKLPNIAFIIAWTIIYICMSIFTTHYVFLDKEKINADVKRIYVFLVLNYVAQALYLPFMFYMKNLFFSYISVLVTFVTILIIALESLIVNKKITLLTLPYILWSIIASIISIQIYLQN